MPNQRNLRHYFAFTHVFLMHKLLNWGTVLSSNANAYALVMLLFDISFSFSRKAVGLVGRQRESSLGALFSRLLQT